MAMIDEVDTLRTIETSLANNKVVNVAYDDTAYESNDADGVSIYDYDNHNNIPVKTLSVLKINETVSLKGFRSIASTLPRMFINHIYGRISYNLNKIVDNIKRLLDALHNYLGQPNGIATLDSTGRLPYSQLPLTAVEYKGAWNADTNTPALASGTGTYGDMYIVSVAGTQDLGEGSTDYKAGDRVIYNGSVWQRFQVGDVHSVNGVEADGDGNVTITGEDIASPDVYIPSDTFTNISSITGNTIYCCVHAEGLFVAGFYSVGVWWSEDGVNWTQSNLTSGKFGNIKYANGIWITGSESTSSGLWWSEDGKTWTQSNITSGALFNGIAYGNRWVACLETGSSPSWQTYWSDDGKTWTECTYSMSYMKASSLLYDDGLWIAGGLPSPYLWWSEDGKTWTACTASSGTTIHQVTGYGIAHINGVWLVSQSYLYSSSGNSTYLLYSTNGKSGWSHTLGKNFQSQNIFAFKGRFFAIGNGMSVSDDGITWSRVSNLFFNYFKALVTDDVLMITAGINSTDGLLLISFDGKKFFNIADCEGGLLAFGANKIISNYLDFSYNELTNKISDLFNLFYKIVKDGPSVTIA